MMIKKFLPAIFFISLAYPALSCKCIQESIEKSHTRYDQIFAGKLIKIEEQTYTFLLLKSWKGTSGTDTLRITLKNEDSCHRYTFDRMNWYYLLLTDAGGIHNCSGSGFYDDSRLVDELDRVLKNSIWINENYKSVLDKIEYDRKFLVQTVDESINIENKRVVVVLNNKQVFELNMPFPFMEQACFIFVIATKNDLTRLDSPPDYIFYATNSYTPERQTEFTQKALKQAIRKLKRNRL